MPIPRKLIKIFLASPGDLGDERKIAKSIIDGELNQLWDSFGYLLELVGWEDTISGPGRPQATINRDLEQCELFVGMMWRKWGTMPDHGGRFSSGFEEEYTISMERFEREQRPEISLLLKEIGSEFLRDPGPDLKKVLAFRERLISEKKILFETFSDGRDFERKFRRIVNNYVIGQWRRESETTDESQSRPASVPKKANKASEAGSPFSKEGSEFLRDFVDRSESLAKEADLDSSEVARFRLLSNVVKTSANDEQILGVHDANLLFLRRDEYVFGSREKVGLLRAGIDHFTEENVPVWHWLAPMDARAVLPFSFPGELEITRRNAISVMRLRALPLEGDGVTGLDRRVVGLWLAQDSPASVRVAALAYIGEFGSADELPAIRKEFERGDSQTSDPAANAIVRIALRNGREEALKELRALQPARVDRDVVQAIFADANDLSPQILMSTVDHRSALVRRAGVKALRMLKQLPAGVAEKLREDSDAEVRYQALMSLLHGDRSVSLKEARSFLVKPTKGPLFSLSIGGGYDAAGEDVYKRFKHAYLSSLKDTAIAELANECSIYDLDAWFSMVERNPSKYVAKLRAAIDDRYQSEVQAARNEASQQGLSSISETAEVENYLQVKWTTRAVIVLTQLRQRADLGRIRKVISAGEVFYSAAAIEFLRDFGEWQDISLIISHVNGPHLGEAAFLGLEEQRDRSRIAAEGILSLGEGRPREMFSLDIPADVMTEILKVYPLKKFAALSDQTLMALLHSKSDRVRKVAALTCVRILAKKRVHGLLERHFQSEVDRYYNVVHWLDLGISLPSAEAKAIARRALDV